MAPKTPETHKTKLQSLVAQKQQPHKNGLQNTCHLLLCDNLPLNTPFKKGTPFPLNTTTKMGTPFACLIQQPKKEKTIPV